MSSVKDLLNVEKITTIITDLDNTLWQGILAEKQELTLNTDYYEFLLSLYKKGIQLIIVSKNDESDVKKTFEKLNLDWDKFTIIISNWDPKYLNIEKILHQTKIRPETTIFVDDNPLERDETKAKLSKIHCLDALDWDILKDIPYLQKRKEQPTSEVAERINRYRTSVHFDQLKEDYHKEDKEFLRSLKRELSIGETSGDNLDRFTRLLVVTHRINFNPEKFENYDKALDYLYDKINSGDKLFAISTRENDVSLGLTGAFVVKIEENKAIIEDGTFSCGIIGRDFEQKAILTLIDILKEEKVRELDVVVSHTSTNGRVKEIFEELQFKIKNKEENKVTYSIDIDTYKPKEDYNWIKVLSTPPEMNYPGHPSVIKFIESYVKPIMKNESKVVNVGSAEGEVIGHLDPSVRKKFYNFIENNNIEYKKVDMAHYPKEENLIGNAEDLSSLFKDESQDVVMAIELLEHTEHFWQVINELIRITKINGYIFISVPTYKYPKHEYPVDLWRIGPNTLKSFFPDTEFKIIQLEKEGHEKSPRRIMILVQKIKSFSTKHKIPEGGKTDWKTGITFFN